MNGDFDTDLRFGLNGRIFEMGRIEIVIADIVLVELIEFPFLLPLTHAMSCIYKQTIKQTNKETKTLIFKTSSHHLLLKDLSLRADDN